MERRQFTTTINAPRERVWAVMLDPSTYKAWARAFSPEPRYEGDWKDGVEDTKSEDARKWIGSTEEYRFAGADGKTELTVDVRTHEDFADMITSSWPEALKLLKDLVEKES